MPKWWNGRRAGLKIQYGKPCAGSSPAFGTIIKSGFISLFFIVKHVGLEQSVKKTIQWIVFRTRRESGTASRTGFVAEWIPPVAPRNSSILVLLFFCIVGIRTLWVRPVGRTENVNIFSRFVLKTFNRLIQ